MSWSFRSSNHTTDFSINKVTLNAGEGGRFRSTSDFTDGDFDGWRLYFKSGNYAKISQSTRTGTQINLILDNLPANELKNIETGVEIIQELVITPDSEDIIIKAIAPDSENTDLPLQIFQSNINKGYLKLSLSVYKDNAKYELEYRYKKF